jgi:hypothetical protein
MTTSRVPQARVHQVGGSDGMVVLGLVPAQNGRNVAIRLDSDSAPAPRPFARPLPDSIHVLLPDVFIFTTGSLARAGISSMLVPKCRWAGARRLRRTTLCGTRKEQLDSEVEFLIDAPRVEFFQGVPLVSWSSSFPVVRDASVPFGRCGVDCFDVRSTGSDCRIRRLDGTVDHECAKTVFKGWHN